MNNILENLIIFLIQQMIWEWEEEPDLFEYDERFRRPHWSFRSYEYRFMGTLFFINRYDKRYYFKGHYIYLLANNIWILWGWWWWKILLKTLITLFSQWWRRSRWKRKTSKMKSSIWLQEEDFDHEPEISILRLWLFSASRTI